ncbi:MAG: haloacid dehalogenase-like hydrolase [Anaerolineae bacterium]|nr:haloacid dehalogenase-like hydrolase [Anaerolineae bacterium]
MLMTGSWRPENRAALEDLIGRVGRGGPEYQADAPPFAVFDWDQTVIRHDIGDALFLHQIEALGFALDHDEFWTVLDPSDVTLREQAALLRELADDTRADHPTFHALREAVLVGFLRSGLLDPQEGFPWQTRLLTGMSEAQIADLTRQAMQKGLTAPLGRRHFQAGGQTLHFHEGLRPYAEILDLMRQLEAHGIAAWIVSATNIWAVRVMAEALGVAADRVIGMRTQVIDGKITANLDGEAVATWGKVKAIQRTIHPTHRPVLVAGDNITDLPMLEYSGDTRLVIDRGVTALRQVAEERAAMGERWLVQPMFEVE